MLEDKNWNCHLTWLTMNLHSIRKTRQLASTGILFAGIQIFRSTFAHSWKRDYCLNSCLPKFSTNIISTTDFYVLRTFRSKFFVSKYRKISLGNTSVYQKISGIENFYASERGGGGGRVSRFFVENFLSHSTEKFRWGTLRCLRKFRVSQNFMHKKGISLNFVEKSLSH